MELGTADGPQQDTGFKEFFFVHLAIWGYYSYDEWLLQMYDRASRCARICECKCKSSMGQNYAII